MRDRIIKKIAVLGAGVMGAQIASHCANAGFEVYLYDLYTANDPNKIIDNALKLLLKLKPNPLAYEEILTQIKPKNYEDNLSDLNDCDLIIEAIAEKIDLKVQLFKKLVPLIHSTALLVTNTSGLSINNLAESLPKNLKQRFCGVHFFNPPRYMHLVELIPHLTTNHEIMDFLESWITRYLGKGVIRAKDTPNFIGNRIGVFSLLSIMHNAEIFGLRIEEVDNLTGTLIGRPKSATFRTMDVVGLDTMKHVVHTMQEELKSDPWHHYFTLPDWLLELINEGKLGQKTKEGIYRKVGNNIEVFDPASKTYVTSHRQTNDPIENILKESDSTHWVKKLYSIDSPQAKFLVAHFNDLFQYCVYHLEEIASNVSDIDFAMRWGFGWAQGPLELWQQAGFNYIKNQVEKALSKKEEIKIHLPEWLDLIVDFYTPEGAYAPLDNSYERRKDLSVYKRQIFPAQLLNERRFNQGILFENDAIVLQYFKKDVPIISFKTKANCINQSLIDGINESLNIVEKNYSGCIIYQHNPNIFCSGADLKLIHDLIITERLDVLDSVIKSFQTLMLRMKYSPYPIIAAVRGKALGGGSELLMHCSRVVGGFESYIGLTETAVGLLPAGGGCKEMALRAATYANGKELMQWIEPYFKQIISASVSDNIKDAKIKGYVKSDDIWLMNKDEVLYCAYKEINHLRVNNFTPKIPKLIRVAGRLGSDFLKTNLSSTLTEKQNIIASKLADVLCGGDIDANQLVNDEWLLKLEREAFIELASLEETKEKITPFSL